MSPLLAQHHPDCYPSTPAEALTFFEEARHAFPPEQLPSTPEGSALAGIITPHIDFRVSHAAYSAAFAPLWEEPLAETYLILGVGHRSYLEWNLDKRDIVTPLGRAECATELVDRLAAGTDPKRFFLPKAHEGEHSIEFPLVWLQAMHQLRGDTKPVRFIPLLCGSLHSYVDEGAEWDDLHDFHHLAESLGNLFRDFPPGEKLRVIVSIDGCHLGPRFDHPFEVTNPLLVATEGWEQKLWGRASTGDVHLFLDWMREEGNDRYFDGVGALALLLAAGAGKFKLQRTFYEQWFTQRDSSAVTFSSGRILHD